MKLIGIALLLAATAFAETTIVTPRGAGDLEMLAARELRRYVYLRTGTLPVMSARTGEGDAIVLAVDKALAPEAYTLKTVGRVTRITGGDAAGVLYGAYRYVEKLGVRFYLHGDVIPDERLTKLPEVNETGKPLFNVRGIQPFHDFPEGPDWWNQDDYLAYIGQLAKLRMNFIGLHCYPEGGVGPEPLVWIGQPSDLNANGGVKFGYPVQWAHTGRDKMWGYAAMKSGDFAAGAAELFEKDDFGPDAQDFTGVGAQMRTVFAEAKRLGVKTCIGTETPLTIPKLVQERLKAQGKDPKDPSVVRELYEGIFRRIATVYPVDYYWLWTPEGWTWGGNKPEEFEATARDIRAALAALEAIGKPFTLATSGWVLGPKHDRAALDNLLPKDSPMSCINREVGHAADEPFFANLTGRPKWVIPWMENDPNLVAPQPWVGRMRWDAADAVRLGCTGLLGIHWRTKQLAPNVAALADAGWDQSWIPADYDRASAPPVKAVFGAVGGSVAKFTAPVTGADEPAVYQTVRYGLSGYLLDVPNGTYTVTLKFNEPAYHEAGKRVFHVLIQNKQVIAKLDIFAKAGANRALDLSFDKIEVESGQLQIDFKKVVEYPCIAGIVITGKTAGVNQLPGEAYARRINCGGDAVAGYEADSVAVAVKMAAKDRAMPVVDFYRDFARANFGENVADAAGKIFAAIDGVKLPEPTTWIKGPGGIKAEKTPWNELKKRYAFVDELAALRDQVKGAGNVERFDYWLNTYRYMTALAEAGCLRGELERGQPVQAQLARTWERMLTFQIAATDTPGELGTIANLEQHNRVLLKFLGTNDVSLAKTYTGPARLIVPTVRTQVGKGESPKLKIISLPATQPTVHIRPMGKGNWKEIPATHLARAVYEVKLPAAQEDFEYYITAAGTLRWPATAPALNQSVIVW